MSLVFDRDCIDFVDCFGFYGHFNILTLLIHVQVIAFRLYVWSSTSFFSVLQFSQCRYFPFLVTFIPRSFILSDMIVNEIVFLFSLSDNSLSVYRKATEL